MDSEEFMCNFLNKTSNVIADNIKDNKQQQDNH